jgi:hypothetical protein
VHPAGRARAVHQHRAGPDHHPERRRDHRRVHLPSAQGAPGQPHPPDLAAALGVCPAVFVGGRRERLGDERPRRSFRRKLRHLFAAIHPPHRGPYTPEEVAASITSAGRYGSISSSYIRELLNSGHEPNPRLRHILALADFFGLGDDHGPQAAYFLDDRLAETIDAELAEFIALRDAGVVEFAARLARHASDWTPELRRQAVHALTEAVETGGTTWVFRSGGARR